MKPDIFACNAVRQGRSTHSALKAWAIPGRSMSGWNSPRALSGCINISLGYCPSMSLKDMWRAGRSPEYRRTMRRPLSLIISLPFCRRRSSILITGAHDCRLVPELQVGIHFLPSLLIRAAGDGPGRALSMGLPFFCADAALSIKGKSPCRLHRAALPIPGKRDEWRAGSGY